MKTLILCLLLLFLDTTIVWANKIDSLESLIKKSVSYKEKSEGLSDLIKSLYRIGNTNKAIEVANTKVELAEAEGDYAGIAKAFESIGFIHQINQEYPLSLESYLQSIEYYSSIGDTLGMVSCYNNIAYNYNKVDMPGESIAYSIKSAYLLRFKKDPVFKSNCYINLARSYRLKGNHDLEIHYLYKSDSTTPFYYNNLGTAYWKLHQYDSAARYYQKALKVSILKNDSFSIARSYNDAGINHYVQGRYSQAIHSHLQAIKYKADLEKSYLELSHAYLATGQVKIAEYYFKESSKKKTSNFEDALAVSEKFRKHFDGIYNLKKAYEYSVMSGDYKDSLRALLAKKYVINEESKIKMAKIENEFSQHQNLQLLQDKLNLEKENDLYRNILLLIVLAFFLALAIKYIVRERYLKMHKLKIENLLDAF